MQPNRLGIKKTGPPAGMLKHRAGGPEVEYSLPTHETRGWRAYMVIIVVPLLPISPYVWAMATLALGTWRSPHLSLS